MFKEGDIVLYLKYYKCVVLHTSISDYGSTYMLKQLDNDKLWIGHEEDITFYIKGEYI